MARTDEEIKRDVVDQLYWDARVDASKLGVEVRNGTVTVQGEAPSPIALGAAEEDAWAIPGVMNVRNQVQVVYPSSVTLPSDDEIRHRIEADFANNPSLDITELRVSVDAGLVTVEGTVDAYWKKRLVDDLALSQVGVVEVVNEVAVVPTDKLSDRAVANALTDALDRNILVDPDDVNVRVSEGNVRLSGWVPNQAARREALDTACCTLGVREVWDNLRVGGLY